VQKYDTIVIGGGFTGLAAALDLSRSGQKVLLLEKDSAVGGLAGSFDVEGQSLEKFYHHWFTNDRDIVALAKDLGTEDRIVYRQTRTGMYFGKDFFRLSSPKDLLSFTPLSLADRIRLGLLALKAQKVNDWQQLENKTSEEWLISMGGETVYRKIWEPMLRGKFGQFASEVSAVWFWNKLKLRGGSRGKGGKEMLAYYQGGFASLAESMVQEILTSGGEVRTNTPVVDLLIEDRGVTGVRTEGSSIYSRQVLATQPLPLFANIVEPYVASEYTASLRKIQFLANVCLVLELDRSLSDTYWLNVADPNFPYVGIIEHTNFEPKESYHGRHIVYLSKYLPESDLMYSMTDEEVLNYSIPFICRMFPAFQASWVLRSHVWRARFAQPIVVRGYGSLIPQMETPLSGLYLCTMAQIYPEDRGTNYAICTGRNAAKILAESLSPRPQETSQVT